VTDDRPVALITGDVPEYRLAPFRALAERERIEVLAFGDVAADADFPLKRVEQRAIVRLAGRYRAVVCGLGGRLALPGAYAAARRARIPFVLWTSIWAHPRTVAHALSWIPTRHLYRAADAVVTYGPHVTRYVERFRSRGAVFEAPQAVDPVEFGRRVPDAEVAAARSRAGARPDQALVLFVGRLVREKGVETLARAWHQAALGHEAVLAFAGDGPLTPPGTRLGFVERAQLPALYAAADALVLPSIRTRTFTEPWGLVTNEAMHQGAPVLATDAVGAAAGGLVRDGRNGLVMRASDENELAARIRLIVRNPELRAQLGAAARDDVSAYTPEAWAAGVRSALNAIPGARLLR
jgi:glycosyltransferase involved in cell wall biosynthesis